VGTARTSPGRLAGASRQRLLRFTLVSVISTCVSLGLVSLVYGVLRLWSEVPSVLFANMSAGVVSYNLNRRLVWGKRGRSHVFREVIPFFTMTLTGLALSTAAAGVAHHLAVSHHLRHLERTALVAGANLGGWGALWLGKFAFFNRLFAGRATSPAGVSDWVGA
jgi:putative flippase GtrA